MAYSSILGADQAPSHPSGRDADLLGPSDNSDSGSDAVGTHEAHADSDAVGTGERGSVTPGELFEGSDIMPDRVIRAGSGDGAVEADVDSRDFTDIDADGPLDDLDEDGSDA